MFKAGTELPDWGRIELRGRKVYIVFDSDSVDNLSVWKALKGLKAMLERRGASARIVTLPKTPDGGKQGLDDYLAAGNSAASLKDYASRSLPPKPTRHIPSKSYPYTDQGNAERLIDMVGEDFRWVESWGSWLHWDGTRWKVDQTGPSLITAAAVESARTIPHDAEEEKEPEARKKIFSWAMQSEMAPRLRATVDLAKRIAGVGMVPEDLDCDTDLLNVANGTIELSTGTLREHRQEDNLTKFINVAYNPDAQCPRWMKFLEEVFVDPEVGRFVWKALGYSLTGRWQEKKFFFLYGPAHNGKSTFLETVRAILGEGEYAMEAGGNTFFKKFREETGPQPELASLRGARFVTSPETMGHQKLDESIMKKLTGGDMIKVHAKFKDPFSFRPTQKIWFSGNAKPKIHDIGPAIWTRLCPIPMLTSFYGEGYDRREKGLDEALLLEREGILAWMVRGWLVCQEERLELPETCKLLLEEYRAEMDVVGNYLSERTIESSMTSIGAKTLFVDFRKWSEENGFAAMSIQTFNGRMVEKGYAKTKTKTGLYWESLDLVQD